MKHVAYVTAYSRPELLTVCLERIHASARGRVRVVISEDCRPKPNAGDVRNVIKHSGFEHVQRVGGGPVWTNIFACLQDAFESDADLVSFIEDDVFVASDYFEFVEAAQKFNPFVVLGDNIWVPPSTDQSAVGLSHSDFITYAFTIRRALLAALPKPTFDRHAEEVIQNYIIRKKRLVVFPLCPRLVSLQWGGINVSTRPLPTGSFDDNIQVVRQAVGQSSSRSWSDLIQGDDRRDRWEQDFKAQLRWGFLA